MPPQAYGSPSWPHSAEVPQARPSSGPPAIRRAAHDRHDASGGSRSPLRITTFPDRSPEEPAPKSQPLPGPSFPIADAEYDYLQSLSRRLAPDQKAYEQFRTSPTRQGMGGHAAAFAQDRAPKAEGSRRQFKHQRTGSAVVIASPRQVAVPLPVANARAGAGGGFPGGGPTVQSAFGPLTLPQSPEGKYAMMGNWANGPPGPGPTGNDGIQSGIGNVLNGNTQRRSGMEDASTRSITSALEHLGLDDSTVARPGHPVQSSGADSMYEEPEIKGIRRIRGNDFGHGRSQSFTVGVTPVAPSVSDVIGRSATPTALEETALPASQEYQAVSGGFPARHGRPAYLTHRPRAISLGFIENPLDSGGVPAGGAASASITLESQTSSRIMEQGPHSAKPAYRPSDYLRHNRSASMNEELSGGGTPFGVRQPFGSTGADVALQRNVDLYGYPGNEITDAEYLAVHAERHHLATISALRQRQQQVAGLYQQQHLESDAINSEMPTRSIWIGNLDPTLSVTELLKYFSPLGVVDSVRMLPEKECACITYSRIENAIRAHEEMQGALVGNSVVRVVFGQAEGMEQAAAAAVAATAAAAAAAAAASAAPVMQPSRALWIGNISPTISPTTLAAIFSPFGPIESCRILTHKSCGFVNFEKTEDAVRARRLMQGQDIGGHSIRVGFAKVPRTNSAGRQRSPSRSPTRQRQHLLDGSHSEDLANGRSQGVSPGRAARQVLGATVFADMDCIAELVSPWAVWGNIADGDSANASEEDVITDATSLLLDAVNFVESGGASETSLPHVTPRLPEDVLSFAYALAVPPIPEPNPHRKVDQYRLREIKKRLDSSHATPKDFENAFHECFDDCVELCSDYIGNTVIQKFAERCSAPLKLKLVKRVAPHLAAIGVHKNGTWSVQKIIDSAKAEAELAEITMALKPYTPPLLLDQFGNYVVQCCLRLGSKFNQFIFDTMYIKCWDIAQGRFGARAMRTCLESQYATRNQKKLVAIAIVENALQLATNANGSILVTWLLDTSQLPGRYLLVAPRFAGHLSILCTHKLASLTMLKIVNQRQEPEARRLILSILFGPSPASAALLEEVLSDLSHGVGILQKCLASQVMEDAEQVVIADRVRQALVRMRPHLLPGHMRLMEEVEVIVGDAVKVANAKATDQTSVEYLYRKNAA